MHLIVLLTALCGLLLQTCAADTTNRKVTIYAWPLSAKTPSPLAQISYSNAANVDSYTPPKTATADEVVRIGLYDKSTKHWSGIATSAASFAPGRAQKIVLHVDARNEVYHVGFSASRIHSGGESKATVEIAEPVEGPSPILNKPVVLNEDGKVEEKQPEKSFLQKYWWAIALFLVLQLVAGGGDAK